MSANYHFCDEEASIEPEAIVVAITAESSIKSNTAWSVFTIIVLVRFTLQLCHHCSCIPAWKINGRKRLYTMCMHRSLPRRREILSFLNVSQSFPRLFNEYLPLIFSYLPCHFRITFFRTTMLYFATPSFASSGKTGIVGSLAFRDSLLLLFTISSCASFRSRKNRLSMKYNNLEFRNDRYVETSITGTKRMKKDITKKYKID